MGLPLLRSAYYCYTQVSELHSHSGRDYRNPVAGWSNPHGDLRSVSVRHPWLPDPGNPMTRFKILVYNDERSARERGRWLKVDFFKSAGKKNAAD